MTAPTRALLGAAALAVLLPVSVPARPSAARLQVTAVVVRRSVVTVRAAEQGGTARAAARPGLATGPAPGQDGPAPVVVFTDGAPPGFRMREPGGSGRRPSRSDLVHVLRR